MENSRAIISRHRTFSQQCKQIFRQRSILQVTCVQVFFNRLAMCRSSMQTIIKSHRDIRFICVRCSSLWLVFICPFDICIVICTSNGSKYGCSIDQRVTLPHTLRFFSRAIATRNISRNRITELRT